MFAVAEEPMRRDWLKTSDVAAELGVHPRTVRNWIRLGYLRASDAPGGYFIHRADLDAFLTRPKRPRGR